MATVVPGMNVLWFCFKNEKERRAMHGTPDDVVRKYLMLKQNNSLFDGIEIFLTTSRLNDKDGFESWFYKEFSKLKYTSVHIGEGETDYYLNEKEAVPRLKNLYQYLQRLETNTIILHINHLKHNRKLLKEIFEETLPGVTVCVENNGFDDEWGHHIESMQEVLSDFPDFKVCLDINHIKDYHSPKLHDYIACDDIVSKIEQVHYSYSTHLLPEDPYIDKGFPGYGPFHALFSVVDYFPSEKTKQFVEKFPIILEGVVPAEDKQLMFLKKEAEFLGKTI